MANRDFLFLDEFGDTGKISPGTTPYFGFSILHITEDSLKIIEKHLNRLRYFGCHYKEIETVLHHYNHIVEDIFEEFKNHPEIHCSVGYMIKADYRGLYFNDSYYNSLKLRNYIMRRTLEGHFENFPPHSKSSNIELIFDRYNTSEAYVQNLNKYLKENYKLPPLSEITQVDSIYCLPIQLSDLLVRIVKKKTEKFAKLANCPSFCKLFNLNS